MLIDQKCSGCSRRHKIEWDRDELTRRSPRAMRRVWELCGLETVDGDHGAMKESDGALAKANYGLRRPP